MELLKKYIQVVVSQYHVKKKSTDETEEDSHQQDIIQPLKTLFYSNDRFSAYVLMYIILLCYATDYNMVSLYQSYYREVPNHFPYNTSDLITIASSVPNTFLCIIVGLLVDKISGMRIVSYILAEMDVVGQIILSIGIFINYRFVILIGTLINGIGNESLVLLINCYMVHWSEGKDICFLFGLNQMFSVIGNTITIILNAYLSNCVSNKRIVFVLLLCIFVGLMVVQLICVVALSRISIRNGKLVKKHTDNNECQIISFRKLSSFSPLFWITVVELSFCNSVIFVLLSNIQDLLNIGNGVDSLSAADIYGFFNLASAMLGPVTGLIVGWIGNLHIFNIAGMFLGFLSVLIILLIPNSIAVPMILLAFCLTLLNTCVFSLVGRAAEHYQMATAFGIAQSGMIILDTMLHFIINNVLFNYGVNESMTVFLIFISTAFACSGIAFYIDAKGVGFLFASDSDNITEGES